MRRFLTTITAALMSIAGAGGTADPLQPFYDFIRRQPQDFALQVLTLSPDGQPTSVISWNATKPMPLASSMKIVVLAAYARAVAAGTLNPEQRVTLTEWESFYLPGLDGGAHAASLKALKLPADPAGRAVNGGQTVTLDQIARFMIETSDNAATDLLLFKLGKDAVPRAIPALGLQGQDDIGPLSGMFTAWFTEGRAYLGLNATQRRTRDWTLAEQVRTTPALRDPARTPVQAQPVTATQETALQNSTPPHGTVQDYAALLSRVLTGQGFTAAELAVMRRHLGWPTRLNPGVQQNFKQFYAKGGSLGAGVLTNNFAFETSKGERMACSVFFRNVPAAQARVLAERLEDFMVANLLDPEVRQKVQAALNR